MRTSNPAGYDNFVALTTATKLSERFRALYFTHTGNVTFTCAVGRNVNGSIETDNIVVNLTASSSAFLLPLTGDEVTVTFSAGTCYALI